MEVTGRKFHINSDFAVGSGTTNADGILTIKFDKAFSKAPSVTVTAFGSSTNTAITPKIKSLSNTECQILLTWTSGTAVYTLPDALVYWIAIAK